MGDIGLLFYPGALAGSYKLVAKVKFVDIHHDEKGLVRTVTISIRKRRQRRKRRNLTTRKV